MVIAITTAGIAIKNSTRAGTLSPQLSNLQGNSKMAKDSTSRHNGTSLPLAIIAIFALALSVVTVTDCLDSDQRMEMSSMGSI